MSAPAIQAEGLAKYYGQVVGVDGLSFEVGRGTAYGFLGANGAGKTTTMRLLPDLLRPSKGRVCVLGIDCHRESRRARRLIGYLPGELPIYPDLTARAYLDYLARLDGRPVDRAYLAELLERFDVSGIDLGRRLREQSHGMKQKIGIVQAMMSRPPVLVLDEPTAGLDPLMVRAFRQAVHDVVRADGATVFLSSHVLSEVETICEHIGLVRGGRMVAAEPIEALRRQAARLVTIQFGAGVPPPPPAMPGVAVRTAAAREWALDVSGPLEPVLQAVAGLPVHDMQIEPFRLERYISDFYGVDVT